MGSEADEKQNSFMDSKNFSHDTRKRLIIGDSLVSRMGKCGDTTIISLKGAKVEHFLIYIINNINFISSFDCIILHFGTNNISELNFDLKYFIEHYRLILMILYMAHVKCILLSSIIPRLDYDFKMITEINTELARLCKGNIYFIPTSRLFTHYAFGKVTGIKRNLYYKDGLHFSDKGNVILRNYFLQKFAYHSYPNCKSGDTKLSIIGRNYWCYRESCFEFDTWYNRESYFEFDTKILPGFHILKFINPISKWINRRLLGPAKSITGVSVIYYEPHYISFSDSLLLFDDICECVQFTRKGNEPRKTAWYGSTDYKYSSIIQKRNNDWPYLLKDLKSKLEKYLYTSFNSVLCNYYSDGNSFIRAHADDEEPLGKFPIIASISLNEERIFNIIDKKNNETLHLGLPSGSLLVMMGATQLQYLHSMDKARFPLGPRINLTFRYTN